MLPKGPSELLKAGERITANRNHWYDGWIYDRFIAPNQDETFGLVRDMIEDGASVLDVGTGTGRLLLGLANKCSRVDGIDLSKTNVETARKNIAHDLLPHVSVYHSSIEGFLHDRDLCYDYAVLSYVVHEINPGKREAILVDLSAHVKKIIVVDYLYPQTDMFLGAFNRAVEFAAGRNHYTNFRSFMAGNGLPGLAERTGLTVLNEIRNHPAGSHIMVLSGSLDQ